MHSQSEIHQQITARILEGLKNGVVPWRKPWRADKNSGSPTNAATKRAYSGINPVLLNLVAMERGYSSCYWATYQQWASLGAQVTKRPADVKAGQWGTQIVFYKQVKKTKIEDGEEKTNSFPILKTFTVFNVDQVEGDVDHLRASQDQDSVPTAPDFRPAQEAIEATGADIRFGGNRAFYRVPMGEFPIHTGGDFIQLPKSDQFMKPSEFFSTLFHELVHWSEARLKWKGSYAMGELIAEMGSCFITSQLNIPGGNELDNRTSYLKSWLKAIQDNPKAILKAASQASKAAAFILSFSRKEQPDPAELQAV